MPEPQQGEVWWADLDRPIGKRPVLVLTRTSAVPQLTNVTVAPVTRSIRGIPSEVRLDPADGVPTVSAVSLENILTVPKRTLRRWIASLSAEKMRLVFAAIRFVFAIPE
ncbi:MAG: type II toxin-antitoxin system PemK/MazF family toxin [Planctomycetota bacterium]